MPARSDPARERDRAVWEAGWRGSDRLHVAADHESLEAIGRAAGAQPRRAT